MAAQKGMELAIPSRSYGVEGQPLLILRTRGGLHHQASGSSKAIGGLMTTTGKRWDVRQSPMKKWNRAAVMHPRRKRREEEDRQGGETKRLKQADQALVPTRRPETAKQQAIRRQQARKGEEPSQETQELEGQQQPRHSTLQPER